MGQTHSRLRISQEHPIRRRRQARRRFTQLYYGCCNRSERNPEEIRIEEANPPRNHLLRMMRTFSRTFVRLDRRRAQGGDNSSSIETLHSRTSQRPRRRPPRLLRRLATIGGCIGGNREESSSGQELHGAEREHSSRATIEDHALMSAENTSRDISFDQHESEGSEHKSNRSSRELTRVGSFRSIGESTSIGTNALRKSDTLIKQKDDIKFKQRGKEARSMSSDMLTPRLVVSSSFRTKKIIHSTGNLEVSSSKQKQEPIVHSMRDFSKSFRSARDAQKKSSIKRPIIYRSNIRKTKSTSESELTDVKITDKEIESIISKPKKHPCNPLDVKIFKESKRIKFEETVDGKTYIINPQNPEQLQVIKLEELLQYGSTKVDQKQLEQIPKSSSDVSLKKILSDNDIRRRLVGDPTWKKMWRKTTKTPRRRIHLMWIKYKASHIRYPEEPWHFEPIIDVPYRVYTVLPQKSLSQGCLKEEPKEVIITTRPASANSGNFSHSKQFDYYYPYIGQTKMFGYSTASASKDIIIKKHSEQFLKDLSERKRYVQPPVRHRLSRSCSALNIPSTPSSSSGQDVSSMPSSSHAQKLPSTPNLSTEQKLPSTPSSLSGQNVSNKPSSTSGQYARSIPTLSNSQNISSISSSTDTPLVRSIPSSISVQIGSSVPSPTNAQLGSSVSSPTSEQIGSSILSSTSVQIESSSILALNNVPVESTTHSPTSVPIGFSESSSTSKQIGSSIFGPLSVFGSSTSSPSNAQNAHGKSSSTSTKIVHSNRNSNSTQNISDISSSGGAQMLPSIPRSPSIPNSWMTSSVLKTETPSESLPSTSKSSANQPPSSLVRTGSSKDQQYEFYKSILDSPIEEADEELYYVSDEDQLSTSV